MHLIAEFPLLSFVDFKNAFDSIDMTVLLKLLGHCVLLAKNIYPNKEHVRRFHWSIIFNGHFSEGFQIGNRVRQLCLLSPLFLLIAID